MDKGKKIEKKERKSLRIKDFFLNIALLAAGIVLFALPQPNFLVCTGLPGFVFFAFVPVFLLVRRASWKTVWLYGFLYGFGCYSLYSYWLAAFHPLGIAVISSLYGVELMLAFPLLKAAAALMPKNGWIFQWVVWCAYEYLKTTGFSGFNYGVTGYSLWRNRLLLQSAAVFGVWGVSALATFPSAWILEVLRNAAQLCKESGCKFGAKAAVRAVIRHKASALLWVSALAAALVYGLVSPVDYSEDYTVKIALVQPNNDPWRGEIEAYSANLDSLIRLSDEALAADSDIDLVVWPETAFVPRIQWHYKYRQERAKFQLVEKLLAYFNDAPVPFLTGNDHAVLGYSRAGRYEAVDYNSALLFRPQENCLPPEPEIYKKMHLVPFTEYFPYEKLFPKLYEGLLNGDTHMWEPGTEPVVFDVAGIKFSTPICFEDTFGNDLRGFVDNGAQAFINISNDAWSQSLACQYQHLSMAVFRCVENRVPAARATASGQTCFVDPNGKVVAMAEPFVQTWIAGEIPVRDTTKKTIYTKYGDFLGKFFVLLAAAMFAACFARKVCKKTSEEA